MDGVFGLDGMADIRKSFIDAHALGRCGQAHEIAAAIVFLASDNASFVTGSTMLVDGGYTAGRQHGIVDLLGLVAD